MSTSSENIAGDVELTFTRDPDNAGHVFLEAVTFRNESSGAWTEPLGSFDIRDLLIALHALTATPTAPMPAAKPRVREEPRRRPASRFFGRKD